MNINGFIDIYNQLENGTQVLMTTVSTLTLIFDMMIDLCSR
jgi:hypothetical protein